MPVIGLVLVALHAGLAWWLRPRHASAALHALAVAFALLAATVGVKFDGAWLTAAWAAEGAAVMWIGLRAERDWFRAAGVALLAAAAGRWLVLSVLQPVPANFRLFANEPTALGVWIIVLCYALAWLHRAHRSAAHTYARTLASLLVAASVATVVLLTAQNQAYWDIQGASNADATFAGQLVLSLTWALYAGVLIAIGIRRGYRPIRYAAIVLFGITVVKVFVADSLGAPRHLSCPRAAGGRDDSAAGVIPLPTTEEDGRVTPGGVRGAGCGVRGAGCGVRGAGCGVRGAGCGEEIRRHLNGQWEIGCALSFPGSISTGRPPGRKRRS